MKAILALGAALVAAPSFAAPPVHHLPGVSDKETIIPYGDIRQSVRGHGNVYFVRDRANQWYRLQMNEGCRTGSSDNSLIFRHHGSSRQIDRFTTVIIGGEMSSCAIKSIRKSQAPPQVNSKSVVTLE